MGFAEALYLLYATAAAVGEKISCIASALAALSFV